MPIFESLEMRPGELPPPVVSRAATERWFPALTVGQTSSFGVVSLAWLLQGLAPLSVGPLWAQVGAGRALAAQAISGGSNALWAAARSVGPGWLGDLKLYAAWAVAGDEGLVLLQTTLVTLATGALLFALRSRGAGWGLAASLAGAGMFCATRAAPAGTAYFGLLGLATLASRRQLPVRPRLAGGLGDRTLRPRLDGCGSSNDRWAAVARGSDSQP